MRTLLVVIVLLSVIAVSGCAQYYQIHYRVAIGGLDQYAGKGMTKILVPVPVMEQDPVFSEGVDNAWNISVVDSKYGPMIEFSTGSTELSNISAEFSTGNGYRPLGPRDTDDYTTGIYLHPVCTVPRLYESRKYISPYQLYQYTSYVYLDENMTSRSQSQLQEIVLDISYDANTYEAGGGNKKSRKMYIQDAVALDMKGWVPVIIRVID